MQSVYNWVTQRFLTSTSPVSTTTSEVSSYTPAHLLPTSPFKPTSNTSPKPSTRPSSKSSLKTPKPSPSRRKVSRGRLFNSSLSETESGSDGSGPSFGYGIGFGSGSGSDSGSDFGSGSVSGSNQEEAPSLGKGELRELGGPREIRELTQKIKSLQGNLRGEDPRSGDIPFDDSDAYTLWQRRCDAWEKIENAVYRLTEQKYRLEATYANSAASGTFHTPHLRPLNKHLRIDTFTPDLAKTKAFYLWYQVFSREMIREEADNSYHLRMLFYYVDKRCFESWSDALSPKQMNDLDVILKHLDRYYPDVSTFSERRDAFRLRTMTKTGVLDYSNRKETLWRLAYPKRDPRKEADYADAWFEGLPTMLRVKMLDMYPDILNGKATVSFMVAEAVRLETNFLRATPADYRGQFSQSKTSTKSSTKTDSSKSKQADKPAETQANKQVDKKPEVCRDFQRGNCPRGPKCPYKHVEKSDSKGKEKDSSSLEESSQVCKTFAETGSCRYGNNCKLSHGQKVNFAGSPSLKL